MIALTGRDETDLREFCEHLAVKPPLVGLLREAVRLFLVTHLDEKRYAFPRQAEWAAKFRRKYPPLRIVHDERDAVFELRRIHSKKRNKGLTLIQQRPSDG